MSSTVTKFHLRESTKCGRGVALFLFFQMIFVSCGIPTVGVIVPEAPIFSGTSITAKNPSADPSYALRLAIYFIEAEDLQAAQAKYELYLDEISDNIAAASDIEAALEDEIRIIDLVIEIASPEEVYNLTYSSNDDNKLIINTESSNDISYEFGQESNFNHFAVLAYTRAFDAVNFVEVYSGVSGISPNEIFHF